jgi:hypothetical protein
MQWDANWKRFGKEADYGSGCIFPILYFLDADGRVQKGKLFWLWSSLAVYPDRMIGPARIEIKNQ